jgi:hypothetical protein
LPNCKGLGTIQFVVLFDLTACVGLLAVIVAAVVILRRNLGVACEAAAGELVCLGCRTPARLLSPDSFICPGCRRDVRELGIDLDRPKGMTRPFWHAVIFSAAVCSVALVTTGVLSSELRVNYVSIQSSLGFTGEAYQSVEVLVTGRRRSAGDPLFGELYADMFLTNGQVVTLVIDSPSRRYRLIDVDGHELASHDTFGEEAALRWLSMAGLDEADPQVRQQAVWMKARIDNYLNGNMSISFGPPDQRPHYTGGGGGSSGSSGPPEWLLPCSVIGWSLIWLVGLRRIIRHRVAPAPAQGEAVA